METTNHENRVNFEVENHEVCVNFEVAKTLKTVGFDWDCKYVYDLMFPISCKDNKVYDDYYNKNPNRFSDLVSAPTLDVAQRWLRENKDFDINIITDFDSVKRLYYVRYVVKDGHYKTYYITNNRSYVYFNTFEEAQEAGIKKALEIILEKGK